MMLDSDRRIYGGQRSLEERRCIMVSMGGHLIEGDVRMEITLGEGT